MSHAPLTDAQWSALHPLLRRFGARGRPVKDLRARMDAIFWMAATNDPWRALPPEHGKADTVSRHFRRLTHAGFWDSLLNHLHTTPPGHPLRQIERLICRAIRRAARIGGEALVIEIRRLGFPRALPGPSWMVANPLLSETLKSLPLPPAPTNRREAKAVMDHLKNLARLLRTCAGRPIPRAIRATWP